MIGTLAGDAIGSPYAGNPLPDADSIFFNILEPSVEVRDGYLRDGTRVPMHTVTHPVRPGVATALAVAAADWYIHTVRDPDEFHDMVVERLGRPVRGAELLAVVPPLMELAADRDEGLRLSAAAVSSLAAEPSVTAAAQTFGVLLSRLGRQAPDGAALRSFLGSEGLGPSGSCSELRPFANGVLVASQVAGRYVMGDGKAHAEPGLVVNAALSAVLESRSWEEAVRRAVAVGGDAPLTASLAGALAERRWEVPDSVRWRVLDVEAESARRTVASAERLVAARAAGTVESYARRAPEEEDRLTVLRAGRGVPVYVIPEGRPDMEAAARRAAQRTGSRFESVTPAAMEARLAVMGLQADAAGRPLDGTYVERPRAEARTLWLQGGELRSSVTRQGRPVTGGGPLPSAQERRETFNRFQRLRDYAEDARTRLERLAGWDHGAEGVEGHLHFATALYPVALRDSVEVWQGDVLRLRAGIDDDGRFRVDAKAATGVEAGQFDYLAGVLNSRDLVPAGAGMEQVMEAIDCWCLDGGKIPTEEESRILAEGGPEADSVRLKYASNVEAANLDISRGVGMAAEREDDFVERTAPAEAVRTDARVVGDGHDGTVYTIGHSLLGLPDFDALLGRLGIEAVIDMRASATSKAAPQFDAGGGNGLDAHLAAADVDYYRAAALSATQRSGPDGRGSLLTAGEIAASEGFRKAVDAIRDGVAQGLRIAVLSSEGDPYSSPRFTLVGRELAHPSGGAEPVKVEHVRVAKAAGGRGKGSDRYEVKGLPLSQESLERRLVRDYGKHLKAGVDPRSAEGLAAMYGMHMAYLDKRRESYGKGYGKPPRQ